MYIMPQQKVRLATSCLLQLSGPILPIVLIIFEGAELLEFVVKTHICAAHSRPHLLDRIYMEAGVLLQLLLQTTDSPSAVSLGTADAAIPESATSGHMKLQEASMHSMQGHI